MSNRRDGNLVFIEKLDDDGLITHFTINIRNTRRRMIRVLKKKKSEIINAINRREWECVKWGTCVIISPFIYEGRRYNYHIVVNRENETDTNLRFCLDGDINCDQPESMYFIVCGESIVMTEFLIYDIGPNNHIQRLYEQKIDKSV